MTMRLWSLGVWARHWQHSPSHSRLRSLFCRPSLTNRLRLSAFTSVSTLGNPTLDRGSGLCHIFHRQRLGWPSWLYLGLQGLAGFGIQSRRRLLRVKQSPRKGYFLPHLKVCCNSIPSEMEKFRGDDSIDDIHIIHHNLRHVQE